MIGRNLASMCCAGLATQVACGAAAPAREDQLNQAFAEIQLHEAAIERGRATLAADPAKDCETRAAAADDVCRHAQDICQLAREHADADALARCAQARDACAASREAQQPCAKDS